MKRSVKVGLTISWGLIIVSTLVFLSGCKATGVTKPKAAAPISATTSAPTAVAASSPAVSPTTPVVTTSSAPTSHKLTYNSTGADFAAAMGCTWTEVVASSDTVNLGPADAAEGECVLSDGTQVHVDIYKSLGDQAGAKEIGFGFLASYIPAGTTAYLAEGAGWDASDTNLTQPIAELVAHKLGGRVVTVKATS